MSAHDRTDEVLSLLARTGAYEALLAMHTHGGTASFTQICTESPQPTALLRAMAAEGFVVTVDAGTLDTDPHGDTQFCLTAKGEAIFGHLRRLRQWIAARHQQTQNPSVH